MIENFRGSPFFRNIQRKIISNNLYKQISRTSIFRGTENELMKLGIIRGVTHDRPPAPPPLPSLSSSNFPTTSNNNLFSSVFCNNIPTNNSFIQKENSTFNNLPVYKTETTTDENSCLNNCNIDNYCTGYSFDKSSTNCLLYNKVPTSISNNINTNIGYKTNYKYDFNNLNTSQKNIIRNDCVNNYLNNTYNTNNLNYTPYYSLGNNNSQIIVDPSSLSNVYTPLDKVTTKTNFTNIDSNIIDSNTNQEINDFANKYTGYLQKQISLLNLSNEKNTNTSYYTQEINNKTDNEANNAKNRILEKKNINTLLINESINGGKNNITEKFENNIDKSNINNKSNTINFYLFIFIVIIFLYVVYYLKKNKYFK
jgi:hypothetical protein